MAFPVGSTPQKLTIDNTKVSGGSNLTDYPVLVKDGNLLDITYSSMQGDGDDIRFTTDLAGENEVPFEIVALDASGKTCQIWVKLTLDHDDDTVFYIWFGDSALSAYASDDPYGSENAWNSNYKAVYHLEEVGDEVGEDYKDSTANANHGQGGGGSAPAVPTRVVGKIGYGQDFDGSADDITVEDDDSLDITDALTLQAWIKADSNSVSARHIWRKISGTAGGVIYFFRIHPTNGYIEFGLGNGGAVPDLNAFAQTTIPTDGTKKLIHCTWNKDTQTTAIIYYDGVAKALDGGAGNTSSSAIGVSSEESRIARGDPAGYFDGGIDELRILNINLSADWVATENNNMGTPSTFITGSGVYEETENKLKYYRRMRFPGPVAGLS